MPCKTTAVGQVGPITTLFITGVNNKIGTVPILINESATVFDLKVNAFLEISVMNYHFHYSSSGSYPVTN
jgi:hypothetical protein